MVVIIILKNPIQHSHSRPSYTPISTIPHTLALRCVTENAVNPDSLPQRSHAHTGESTPTLTRPHRWEYPNAHTPTQVWVYPNAHRWDSTPTLTQVSVYPNAHKPTQVRVPQRSHARTDDSLPQRSFFLNQIRITFSCGAELYLFPTYMAHSFAAWIDISEW